MSTGSRYKNLIDKSYRNYRDNNLRKHYEQLPVSLEAPLKIQFTVNLKYLRYIILAKQK